jgi:hypothetical protein
MSDSRRIHRGRCEFPGCPCPHHTPCSAGRCSCGHAAVWHRNEGTVGSHVAGIVQRVHSRDVSELQRTVEEQKATIESLMSLVQATSSESKCVICMESPCCVVLKPCGHARFCRDCTAELRRRHQPCPLCRANVRSHVSYLPL